MDDILTTAKAARLLGVSIRTAQLWVESGEIESWKTPGGHRRIPLQSVLQLMKKREKTGLSATATAVVLAGEGRGTVWAKHGLRGSGLLLDITEDPTEASALTTEKVPALIVVEDPEIVERGRLLRTVYANPRFKQTTIASIKTGGPVEAEKAGAKHLQTRKYADVGATADALVEALQLSRGDIPAVDFDVPWNEQERLRAVRDSELVNSAPDRGFDQIVDLAAKATDSPVAMFTLLTESEQWFKSRMGFDGDRTSRDWAFCNETLMANELTVLEDLTADERFASNPTLGDPYNFRFYAGAPVRDQNGFALGSICVIDYVPRVFKQRERDALATTADAASNLIRLRVQDREIQTLREFANA